MATVSRFCAPAAGNRHTRAGIHMAATMPAAGTTRRTSVTSGATNGTVNLRKGMRGTPTGRTRIPVLGRMVVTGTAAAAGIGIDGAGPSRAAVETSVPTAGSNGAAVYSLRASSGWRTTATQSAAGRGRRLAKDQSATGRGRCLAINQSAAGRGRRLEQNQSAAGRGRRLAQDQSGAGRGRRLVSSKSVAGKGRRLV